MFEIEIGCFHLKTVRAGESGYYEIINTRPRGIVTVAYDNRIYVYKGLQRKDTKRIKAAIRSAWCLELCNENKLTGKFPSYSIE